MSKFFEYYNTTEYELSGKTFTLTNITLRYKFRQNLAKNVYNFYDYTLKDGERLDHLADTYYGNSKYVWVIILANDMIDPQFDIPRPYQEFRKYVENKYGSWENVVNGAHHYERISVYKDTDTKIVDLNPPLIIDEDQYNSNELLPIEKKLITNLEYEEQINESKRNIKLLDVSQLNLIIQLVESVFE
tara:strand:- start:462 stop:1025 length:564 start_codon:yes stop_codon:yes gene_type:complete